MADNEPVLHAIEQQKILRNIAEDIKMPLLRILADVQTSRITQQSNPDYIEATADAAIKLLDSFILSTQIYNGQHELDLEPVSVAAAMQDTAQYLYRYANQNNCELQIVTKRKGLAMANAAALQAALVGLAYSFITASTGKKERITFSVDNEKGYVGVGVSSKNLRISSQELKQARELKGSARQLVPNFSHSSSAGILVADTLFSAMSAPLRVGRSQGLVANLLPSRQIALL